MAKNLPRLPQSDCNAIMPAFLYRASCHFGRSEEQSDGQSGEISHIVRLFLQCTSARIPIHNPYCIPARSFDFVPRFPLGTPLRMTICAACLKRSLPTACRRCLILRTGVITLSCPFRGQLYVNNITMPRSGRRLRRATFYYLKQIARAKHPTFRRVMRSGAFAFAEHMKLFLSLAQNRGFCTMSVGNGARLQAAFYAACLKRSLPTRKRRERRRNKAAKHYNSITV